MKTWLLLTAYRKSPVLYPTVPLLTPYDLPFSHIIFVTDRQAGRRTDDNHSISTTITCMTIIIVIEKHSESTNEMENEMERYRFDILGLAEMRWTASGAVSYTHLTLPTNREV